MTFENTESPYILYSRVYQRTIRYNRTILHKYRTICITRIFYDTLE